MRDRPEGTSLSFFHIGMYLYVDSGSTVEPIIFFFLTILKELLSFENLKRIESLTQNQNIKFPLRTSSNLS